MNRNMVHKISCFAVFSCFAITSNGSFAQSSECAEQESVKNSYLNVFQNIEESTDLEIDHAKNLIRPFSDRFVIDGSGCSGYTTSVINKAEEIIRNRRYEIKPLLEEICSQSLPTTHDLELIAAIAEQKDLATEALSNLSFQVTMCT